MEKIWENPVTKIVLAAGVLIAAFFIGKTEAFKNLFAAAPSAPKPADGTACLTKDTVPLPGAYKNGTCVATPDHAGNSGGGGTPDTSSASRSTNAPATIQVWVGAVVPYSYMGCTYGHPYYITYQGQRVKVLSKISCP